MTVQIRAPIVHMKYRFIKGSHLALSRVKLLPQIWAPSLLSMARITMQVRCAMQVLWRQRIMLGRRNRMNGWRGYLKIWVQPYCLGLLRAGLRVRRHFERRLDHHGKHAV